MAKARIGSDLYVDGEIELEDDLIVKGQVVSLVDLIAPFVVTSTQLVNNLNVDLLDGEHGSYYLDLNNATGILGISHGGTGLSTVGSAGQLLRSTGTGLEYFTHDFISSTLLGAVNGIATLDATGKVPLVQLPTMGMQYKGTWNASTNTPTLSDATGNDGEFYRVVVGGIVDLGSGSIEFKVGDDVIHNGIRWELAPAGSVTPDLQAVTDQGATTTNNITVSKSGFGSIMVMNSDSGSYVVNGVTSTESAIAGSNTIHAFGISADSSLGTASFSFINNTTSDIWTLEYSSGLSASLGAGNQLRVQQDPVHNNDLARKLYVDTGLNTKFDIPTGTTAQYIRGDGSLATFPSIPTVGDGVLTLAVGTGLTGSATFSANQSGNSTFTVGLGTNLANLNAVTNTGFLKRTGTNTWSVDTTTYMAASNAYTKTESDARYLSSTNKYVSVFNNPATTDSVASLDFDSAPMSTILRAEPAVNSPEGSGLVYTFGDASSSGYQLFQGHGYNDSFWYRTRLTLAGGWREWLQVASRSWTSSTYVQKAGDTMTGTLNGTRIILNDQFEVVNPTAPNHKVHLVAAPEYTRLNMGYGAHTTFQIHVVENGTTYFVHNIGDGSEQRMLWDTNKNVTFNVAERVHVNGDVRSTGQLVSTVATGTSPLQVTSSTLVTNLNADFLDGQHGSYYLSLSNATGVLPVAKGGTGLNTIGTAGQMLRSTGTALEFFTPSYPTGTGTAGYIPKWGTSSSLNDSAIYQDGSGRIGIGTTSMDVKLVVDGGLAVYGNSAIRPDGDGNGIFNVWRDIVVGDTVNDVHGTVFIHDGIGSPLKNSNAAFEVKSTTKGVLFPRMTAAQRDAIAGPAGMVVYNTTANAISLHNGTSWIDLASSSFPTNYVTTDTNQTGLGGNKTWTGHHIIAPNTTSSPATVADSVRISRNSNGAFMTIENGSAVSAVTLRSWNGGTDNKYQISLLTGGIETGSHGNSENWYTAWSRIDSSNLGKTGNGIIINNTTLNSEQAWTDLPVGFSAFVYGNVGTANGAPDDTFGYFTKVANRDSGGGWAGLWIDYNYNAFYVGKASTNSTYATWSRVLTSYTPTTLSTGQLLRWNGTGWANWTPDFAASSATVSAGNGLTGGGAISSNPTITLGTPGNITLSSSNSVSTSSHTHAFVPGGTTSQYIRGDGTLATFPAIPTNYVTTNSNQTGLSGNKAWTGSHSWVLSSNVTPSVAASSIAIGKATSGIYLIAYDNDANQAFALRTYAASNYQLTLNKGGVETSNHGNSSQWNSAYTWVNTYGSGLQGGPYVPTSRTVSAGNGLTGGGSLATNISLSVNFGTSAGTVAQGNDSRINNGQTAYGWGNHASAGYVPSTRTVGTAGSLTGGGNLGSNRTFQLVNDNGAPGNNKYYGTNNSGVKGFYDLPSGGGGTLTGGGSSGYISKWSGGTSLDNSVIYQDGSGNIGIGTTNTDGNKLYVWGNFRVSHGIYASQNIQTGSHFYGSSAILSGSLDVAGSDSRIGGGSSASCAVLTLNSTSKGLLVPRMTRTQRVSISSPQPGLIVFQTDTSGGDEQGFWGYLAGGQGWRRFNFQ